MADATTDAFRVDTKGESHDDRLRQAKDALAIVGGKLTGEEDITYAGTKFVIPEHFDLGQGLDFLRRRYQDEETVTQFSRIFPYRPKDGARAAAKAIREACGMTLGRTIHSFFGSQPPSFITVQTGPNPDDTEQVPWGEMYLPGYEETTLTLHASMDRELGEVFAVVINGPRKYRYHFEGLFRRISDFLAAESIYKGKAIDGSDKFLDPYAVHWDDVVYTEAVETQLEANVWSAIRHADALERLGQSPRRAVLFEGPFGTGKTNAALLTAQVAMENGWTFLMNRPGRDDLRTTMQTARMYQPAVVFFEDIDTMAGSDSTDISTVLDMMDGFDGKGLRIMAVFTTNYADRIHKGVVRPGRLDAVIHVGAMDRPGVEKLTRRVVKNLADDVDFDAVFEAMDGYMPAFVHEALNRVVRYSVAVNDGELGVITTEDLVRAADGLRDQLALMEGAKDKPEVDPMAKAFKQVVTETMHGSTFVREGGERIAHLSLNGH